jgi:3-phosphoshikimate 1-carboxyvinyltransferase
MIEIKSRKINKAIVTVPGSKSYTHRTFIASALSDGLCKINNWLDSQDTNYTLSALSKMGVKLDKKKDGFYIQGMNGSFGRYDAPIDLGNSGTSMRLLTGLAGLGQGTYIFSGSDRMHQRPINDLLNALNQIGISASSINSNGCPPVKILGGKIKKGRVDINCSISSQYLSALLFIAPFADGEVHLHVTHGPVSKPYIDLTLDIMEKFGVRVEREGYIDFFVLGNQKYQSGEYDIEPDCSQASYFWAAAAISGATVKVTGIFEDSKQGDLKFIHVLKSMGCHVSYSTDGISVTGGKLSGIEVDMGDMPDLVPTLAVIASFAKGVTRIKNVAHLKAKESDRMAAVKNELNKIGISSVERNSDLIITGGHPNGTEIETYNDHRIAMSFAVAGLLVPGIKIKNEKCVEKSFPNFWDVFNQL